MSQLPCDGDGVCMLCKIKPADEEKLICYTCITPWHASCLVLRPETLASTLQWECPDCTTLVGAPVVSAAGNDELVTAIRAIESDESLTEREKAKKRQELLTGKCESSDSDEDKSKKEDGDDLLALLGENFKCSFCMKLPDRPVTTPCGHNFCLNCFQKWIREGKRICVKCRGVIPDKMASQPRINSSLVEAIRTARMSKSSVSGGPQRVYHFIHDQDRPDKAFTSERAKKAGMANASSGRIFVTVPGDHFGPILAENDPTRKQGVLVGESWMLRMECRQWGIHYPPVAGIAGQSVYGAQSVVLSGGYEDDEDHGEWFLYTGSGGRDLSGNKRTNKDQSFDQKFDASNEALRVSCKKGYPVRVVRSFKEKRSSYAPQEGLRYDGIYRIEKCWRKDGKQGFKVCRYLFVRCDNEPAPWTSNEHGDRPRPLPSIPELKMATEVSDRKDSPSWDYDEEREKWVWKKSPPISKKQVGTRNPEERNQMSMEIRAAQHMTVKEKLLREFRCRLCKNVMKFPVTTPCAHNFCKACLEAKFSGKTFTRDRTCQGGRTLRAKKNVMDCPSCTTDISDFLQNPQVNRELMDVIEKLQSGDEERKNDKEDEASSEAELSNGETEINDEFPKEEAHDTEGSSDILSEKENSQADGATEEAGCKRKPETIVEKPKKNSKRKKTETKASSDSLSEKENSQADGATEEAVCRRKPETIVEKPKKNSKRKKTETEASTDILSEKENSQADGATEEAGCKRKPETVVEKPTKNSKPIKTVTKESSDILSEKENLQADGATEEAGCKRKPGTVVEKPTENSKPIKTVTKESSDILSEKENSQADGATEEAGCKRKPETVVEKPTKNSKRMKTVTKESSDILSEKENLQADGAIEEAGCKRKSETITEKPKKSSKVKKTEAKDESVNTVENGKVEKISEKKADEKGEVDEKVDGGDKVKAVVKSRAKVMSGLRRGRTSSKR